MPGNMWTIANLPGSASPTSRHVRKRGVSPSPPSHRHKPSHPDDLIIRNGDRRHNRAPSAIGAGIEPGPVYTLEQRLRPVAHDRGPPQLSRRQQTTRSHHGLRRRNGRMHIQSATPREWNYSISPTQPPRERLFSFSDPLLALGTIPRAWLYAHICSTRMQTSCGASVRRKQAPSRSR